MHAQEFSVAKIGPPEEARGPLLIDPLGKIKKCKVISTSPAPHTSLHGIPHTISAAPYIPASAPILTSPVFVPLPFSPGIVQEPSSSSISCYILVILQTS